jgi:hypothetical protein
VTITERPRIEVSIALSYSTGRNRWFNRTVRES